MMEFFPVTLKENLEVFSNHDIKGVLEKNRLNKNKTKVNSTFFHKTLNFISFFSANW